MPVIQSRREIDGAFTSRRSAEEHQIRYSITFEPIGRFSYDALVNHAHEVATRMSGGLIPIDISIHLRAHLDSKPPGVIRLVVASDISDPGRFGDVVNKREFREKVVERIGEALKLHFHTTTVARDQEGQSANNAATDEIVHAPHGLATPGYVSEQ